MSALRITARGGTHTWRPGHRPVGRRLGEHVATVVRGLPAAKRDT